MPVESLAPNGHLQLVKRILGHVIRIELVNLPHGGVDVRLVRFAEEEEFDAGEGLEAGDAEEGGLEDFDAGAFGGG